MTLHLGDDAPNFEANTTHGFINFHNFLGDSWGILLSHPADYTPVCTTELGRTAQLSDEFKKRGVKAIAVSVDAIEDHHEWIKDINQVKQTNVDFPLIADQDRLVSTLYDMIHPNASGTQTVRSVFIIDPQKKIRLTMTYPASAGRNFDEILRVIDSLQLSDQYKVATPADWNLGDDVIISLGLTTSEAIEKFPKGITEVKPYLRYTPYPKE
ncbi:peroxiredoxin [Sphingobacterium zeae]|uniref:Alkyl hydroperoxide reductase subunit AhpC n=1 Tax=Sphingobacterium zeae TaxID=1776859 RepID=A0ABU0U751_9SPHI|nr:peroxiredoxin [Sphingobacterium zeae]MDQ1150786.1 alkyl hydroperoxide reductase subunit AhpC [Sphingobacterium zeae]